MYAVTARTALGMACCLLAACAILTAQQVYAAAAGDSSRPRIVILDGEANPWHDTRATTPLLHRMLEQTGLFSVEVISLPADLELEDFAPDFTRYQAVVLNYDAPDGRWPQHLQRSFEQYMRDGGGLVIVHSADNAFPGWQAFNEMSGVGGWRGRDRRAGPYWYLDDAGTLVEDHSAGEAGSHGSRLPFRITVRKDHPITRGLPMSWMHASDELYAGLRGPGRDMTVLASAWSDPANLGTGRHEPMLMVVSWGRGRIFHTTLGHDPPALASVDFVVTFQRGTEWAATGAVTQGVPQDFPSDTAPRIRAGLLP